MSRSGSGEERFRAEDRKALRDLRKALRGAHRRMKDAMSELEYTLSALEDMLDGAQRPSSNDIWD